MFEYGQAILVRPVVKYFAKEKNGDALRIIVIAIPRGLRIKKILGFLRTKNRQLCANPGTTYNRLTSDFHPARFERIGHVLLPILRPINVVSTGHILVRLIHTPQSHRPRRPPDPGQQNGAEGDGWRGSTTANQHHLRHQQPASPQEGVPSRTLQNSIFQS